MTAEDLTTRALRSENRYLHGVVTHDEMMLDNLLQALCEQSNENYALRAQLAEARAQLAWVTTRSPQVGFAFEPVPGGLTTDVGAGRQQDRTFVIPFTSPADAGAQVAAAAAGRGEGAAPGLADHMVGPGPTDRGPGAGHHPVVS